MSNLPALRESTVATYIHYIRGKKVMLDYDLATLYAVETRVLKQAVKRNMKRFPADFLFELTDEEIQILLSQNVIPSKKVFGGSKPFAFTEQGVAMLSGILNSEIAIQVNIAILRTFVKLRELLLNNKVLSLKVEKLEQKYDEQFRIVFTALKQMLKEENEPRPKVGFRQSEK